MTIGELGICVALVLYAVWSIIAISEIMVDKVDNMTFFTWIWCCITFGGLTAIILFNKDVKLW